MLLNIVVWFLAILSSISSENIERISATIGQTISFNCKLDESVYFGQQLNQWSKLNANNRFNIEFTDLTDENIRRITFNSAQSINSGFYACQKSVGTTTDISQIYRLIVANVDSFYWTYVCHGAPGSCIRSEDNFSDDDDRTNRLEIADRTNVDLFCCATVFSTKKIHINMNSIGDIRENIYLKRKHEADGSMIVCANQHTFLSRISTRNSPVLTCELVLDGEIYSSISMEIIIKDAMKTNPDFDPPYGYTPSSKDNNDDEIGPINHPGPGIDKMVFAIVVIVVICVVVLVAIILLIVFVVHRRAGRLPTV